MKQSTTNSKLTDLRKKKAEISKGGGEEKIAKQHAQGKLTARERLQALFDGDSFLENQTFIKHRCHQFGMGGQNIPSDGVVTFKNNSFSRCFRPPASWAGRSAGSSAPALSTNSSVP